MFYKSTFYKSMFYKSTVYKSMFYKSTFYKSMFYKSTFYKSDLLQIQSMFYKSNPIQSTPSFTICLNKLQTSLCYLFSRTVLFGTFYLLVERKKLKALE